MGASRIDNKTATIIHKYQHLGCSPSITQLHTKQASRYLLLLFPTLSGGILNNSNNAIIIGTVAVGHSAWATSNISTQQQLPRRVLTSRICFILLSFWMLMSLSFTLINDWTVHSHQGRLGYRYRYISRPLNKVDVRTTFSAYLHDNNTTLSLSRDIPR